MSIRLRKVQSMGVQVDQVITRILPNRGRRDTLLKYRFNDDLRQLGRSLRLALAAHAGAYFKALSNN